MSPRHSVKPLVTLIALASAAGTPLFAQAQRASPMEELVVTARKQEESVLSVPLSVNVLSSAQMEEANIGSVTDIAANTVGLSINAAFGRQADRPVMRGMSSIFADEELAGYFIDGVYVAGSMQSFDLDSVERVEVIKGPQSAVFGRRTFSGAINYITKRPEVGFGGRVKAELGQNGHQVYTGTVEGGSETLAARATLRYYDYDSQFENDLPGGPAVGGQQSQSGNVSIYWSPTETTDIHWNVSYQEDDDDHFPLQLQRAWQNNCFGGAYHCGELKADKPIFLGGFFDNADYGQEQDRFRSFVQITQQIGDMELQWTSAVNRLNFLGVFDQSYAAGASFWHDIQDRTIDDVSHEVRLTGYALDDRLTWTAGAYYLKEELKETSSAYLSVLDRVVTNTAVTGSLAYDITDWLQTSIEARYAEDEIDQESSTPATRFAQVQTFYADTYRWTLSANLSEDQMVYANVATGTLPGGFNDNPDLPEALIAIEQQEVIQYELGYKGQLSDSLRLTAAAYHLVWEKQAQSEFANVDRFGNIRNPGISYRDNKGESEITGIELELMYQPNDHWLLTAGAVWQDAEATKYITTDARDILVNGGDPDLSGSQLPLTSEWEALGSVTYYGDIGSGWSWRARLDGNWQSSRYVRGVNKAETGDLLIANGNIAVENEQWTLTLFGRNLTDEDAPVSILRYTDPTTFGTAFAITPQREREFGMSVAYRF